MSAVIRMKKTWMVFTWLIVLLGSESAAAWNNILVLDAGVSNAGTAGIRVSYARDLGVRLLENSTGVFGLRLEAGAGYYFEDGSSDVLGIEALPLAVYKVKLSSQIQPYLEGGAGGVYLTEKNIEGNRLGGHLQFVEILGLGVCFGSDRRQSIGFRFVHYSNADVHDENEGINYYLLSYGVSF